MGSAYANEQHSTIIINIMLMVKIMIVIMIIIIRLFEQVAHCPPHPREQTVGTACCQPLLKRFLSFLSAA